MLGQTGFVLDKESWQCARECCCPFDDKQLKMCRSKTVMCGEREKLHRTKEIHCKMKESRLALSQYRLNLYRKARDK